MNYNIRELSRLAGVSARTLRYYDEIGLLKPSYVNDAGYRFYGDKEVNLLQQILFFRERGFDLKTIQEIIYQEQFDIMHALEEHLLALEEQKKRTDLLIGTVKQTIASMKGEIDMNDREKFEAFKEKTIKENEEKYGKEAREKYGSDQVDSSNRKLLNMSENEWKHFQELESEIRSSLEESVRLRISPESEEAKRIVLLHREWLGMTWKQYSPEAHKGLTQMYTADERFKSYYDKEVPGCAAFLAQAAACWADKC